MPFRADKKQFLLQFKRRISDAENGTPIWETDWEDITKYLVERITPVSFDIDDQTLQGRIEQDTVMIQVNNITGKFNPEGTTDSFWDGTTEFMYHSRLRLFEWNSKDFGYDGITEPTILPIIDGLLAKEPVYREDLSCDLRINSKLDILREHYILEDIIGRTKSVGSQSIIKFAEALLNTTYAELGIITTGGLFRSDIIYTNITPYDRNLLELLYQAIKDGGGVGGLNRDSTLFFSYYGATPVTRTNFEDDDDCIGLWLMDDTDYNGGVGTTIFDKSGLSRDLVTDNSFTNNWKTNGFFDNNVRTWRRCSADYTGLNTYTIELIIRVDINRLPVKNLRPIGASVNDLIFHPIFAFTEESEADMSILDLQHFPPIDPENCEGLFINSRCELHWVRCRVALAGPVHITVEDENEKLSDLFGEGFFEYIAVTVDVPNNKIRTYLNAQLQSTIEMPTLGGLSIEKIVGTGFGKIDDATPTFFEDLGTTYFSSMKISDVVKTNSEIFTQYTKLFGSTYTIG